MDSKNKQHDLPVRRTLKGKGGGNSGNGGKGGKGNSGVACPCALPCPSPAPSEAPSESQAPSEAPSEAPSVSPTASCTDAVPGWTDLFQNGCEWYEQNFDEDDCPTIAIGANIVCCWCGGGIPAVP